MSGLVLVTGAAGGGPGPAGRRMAGLLLDRGVRCVPSHRRETTVRSTFGSRRRGGRRGSARDRGRRAGRRQQPSRRHSHSVQLPEQRCPACGFRQAGWSAPAEWVAGAGGLLPGIPAVPLGSSCGKCSQGTMRRHARPLARHNRAICTQTTEPAIKPTQVNIRRSGCSRFSAVDTLRYDPSVIASAHTAADLA